MYDPARYRRIFIRNRAATRNRSARKERGSPPLVLAFRELPGPVLFLRLIVVRVWPLAAHRHFIPTGLQAVVRPVCQYFQRPHNFPWRQLGPTGKVAK